MPGSRGSNKQGSASRAIQDQFNQAFIAGNKSEPGLDRPKNGAGTKSFTLLVDNVPYEVKIQPFDFNEEQRFYVNVNAGRDGGPLMMIRQTCPKWWKKRSVKNYRPNNNQ